ncbi:Ig-like domain-containing protein [Pseudomonas sp. dw_358]|uniref:Ig-like domain-containing protein n=1 Tax=Pseudomonas sp. dw_358 TaxID=2720083 RepID=UPI001BD45958|nr:Ig-like domain-containing protein [Pseudomonas sp. dw_358]
MTIKSILARLFGRYTKGKTMNVSVPLTTLIIGGTTLITASEAATFASSNDAILTVDSTGLVTGVADGSGSVVATSVADTTQTSTINFTVTASALSATADTPVVAQKTELEKLEELIEKLELETLKEIKAGIAFLKALV